MSRRLRIAEVLAFISVVAALVGAVGPAERLSTTYSWPPPELSESTPSRVWYTPLLLQRRFPESLTATLPCSRQPALPAADRPVTVLATARSPENARGLAIRQEGDRLVVGVGDAVLGYLPLSTQRAGETDCAYRLSFAREGWSVAGGPNRIDRTDDLDLMPVVNGFFSGLDLRASAPVTVEVTTEVHGSDPIVRQAVAWVVAAICLAAALLLVAFERLPRPRTTIRERLRRVAAHAHPVDAAIAVVLLAWWVLSPAFWDDGWTMARQAAFGTTGSFSNYYDSFGAALPLGYWLEWLQHWLTQSTTAILLLRLPALLCLAATWLLVRWTLRRVLTSSLEMSAVVLWSLAVAFAVGAMAWGMTLRLEPVVAFLVMGVVACVFRFLQAPSAAPLAAIAVLVPLVLTAHPVGVVALAPLIVTAPTIARWLRLHFASAVTMAASTIAALIVLAFVGSDVRQRSADAQIIGEASTTVVTWRDEVTRYDVFSSERSNEFDGYGTPLRRASVALIFLAILAWAVRLRRRPADSFDHLPASMLALSLVLLVTTPSKWPWHFGALIGVLALAVAAETAAVERSAGSRWRRVLVVATAALAIAWAWAPQRPWNTLDLRTLDWARPFEAFPLVAVAVGLPLIALVGLSLAHARRSGERGGGATSRVVPWTLPALLLPMIALTVAFLVADTAATNSWTLTRQTLNGVRGAGGCGLADDLLVPRTDLVRPVREVVPTEPRAVPVWVPPSPAPGLRRFVVQTTAQSLARSPWFQLPPDRQIGLYLAGTPRPFDRIGLEWGRKGPSGVRSLGYDLLELLAASQVNSIIPWRLVAAGELPTPPRRADAVRLVLRTDAPLGSAIAHTAPLIYSPEPLSRRLDGVRSLVQPNIRMYLPCALHARLSGGSAEVASMLVTSSESISPVRFDSSPFAGVLDLYRLERLSIADSYEPTDELVVFGVDTRIPGGRLAPPRMTSS